MRQVTGPRCQLKPQAAAEDQREAELPRATGLARARLRTVSTASKITLLLAILAACAPSPDWTEFRGQGGNGRAAEPVYPPLGVKWELELAPPVDGRRFFNPPVVKNRTAFFGSADGNFYALDLDRGAMKWVFSTGGPINSVAAIDDTQVYFGSSDGNYYALDWRTGALSWKFQSLGPVNSTIVVHNQLVLGVSDVYRMEAFYKDGSPAFHLDNPNWLHFSFQVTPEGIVAFAPNNPLAPGDLAVYSIPGQRYLWAIDANDTTHSWFSFPAVGGDGVYYSTIGVGEDFTMEFSLHRRSLATGTVEWSVTAPQEFPSLPEIGLYEAYSIFSENTNLLDFGAPVLAGDRVIFAAGDSLLRAYAATSGSLLWARELPRPIATAPIVAGDRIYFGLRADEEGRGAALVCASLATGTVLWSIPVDGSPLNSPVIADSMILFGTEGGVFYVFEEFF